MAPVDVEHMYSSYSLNKVEYMVEFFYFAFAQYLGEHHLE